MSKFVNLSIIVVALLLILKLAGIDTGADDLLNKFGLINGSLSNSQFIISLGAMYAMAAAAAILIGFFTKSASEWSILALGITLGNLWVLYGAFDHLGSTVSSLAFGGTVLQIIFWIFGLIYAWSAFEFVVNR